MRRARPARAARYLCEAAAVATLLAFFRMLPLDWASALGACIGGLLGPALPVHRRGLENIARALPELSDAEVRACARRMWRHLGRTAAEYPHLRRFSIERPDGRVELVGRDNLEEARRSPTGGIFVTGHVGNWELTVLPAEQTGIPLATVYRAANNPIVDRMIQRLRSGVGQLYLPKGASGAREMVRALAAGKHLLLLVDQKLNTGIPVPFFGRDAMTPPAVAALALKYDCPLWPLRVERLKGATFRVTVLPKLAIPKAGTREERIRAIMVAINATLEGWIRERPEQWLWLHRRWPD